MKILKIIPILLMALFITASAYCAGGEGPRVNRHKQLGQATGIAAVLSAASAGSDLHCPVSYVTAGLALATTINGYRKYGSFIWTENGSRKLKWHSALCSAASAGFIFAAVQGGEEGHGAVGMISGITMLSSILVMIF